MMDCETKVIFTKDPTYIINAHSWPEDAQRKPVPVQNGLQNPNQPVQGQTNNPNPSQPNAPGTQNLQNTIVTNVTGAMLRNPQQQTPNVISANLPAQPESQEAIEDPTANKQKLNKKERKDFLIKEMRKRIDQYFEINVRQVGDMVPKIITNFLINDILVELLG